MRRVSTFVPMETETRRGVPELVAVGSQEAVTESTEAGGTKRSAKEELDQQSSKKQKTYELSQEELQQLMIIVLEEGMNVEALQTKYPIIDWEIYIEDTRIQTIESGSRRFNSTEPTEDKEIELWVELKRLFEPDADDELWMSHKHVHDLTWRLYDTCGVHHVSTKDGVDISLKGNILCQEVFLHRCYLQSSCLNKIMKCPKNFLGRYSCRLKDQEDEVFGRILSKNKV
ncbi:hypothetical protein Tco_0606369, partial [Tanacetum coccineum]